MIYHLKAYGFLFPIKDAVRILELLPCCHGNMHSGIFRHISSLYPIEALLYLSTNGSTWPSRYIEKSINSGSCLNLSIFILKSVLNIVFHGIYRPDLREVQCTSDIVATLGGHFLATISNWPLYST